jgi:recombinational DNA repair protein RecR
MGPSITKKEAQRMAYAAAQTDPDSRAAAINDLVEEVCAEQRDRTISWIRGELQAGEHLEDLLDL